MSTTAGSRARRSRPRPPGAAAAARAASASSAREGSPPWFAVALAALAVAVLAVYAPTLRADFVNWDDPVNVVANPRVTEPAGVIDSWTTTANPEFLPLTYTSFWLEWRLAGGAPWLFHLDNALLHAANAVLVALVARAFGLAPVASLLVAGVWSLHPVQVATVAWITERKNVLYVLGWLGSLLLYVRALTTTDGRRARAYGASLVLFALAILSKGAAITLPAALALVEWSRGRLDRRALARLAPYAVLALAGGLWLLQRVPGETAVGPALGARLLVAARALWFYVLSFVWPVGLLPVYPRWSPTEVTPTAIAAVGATILAAAVIAAARRRIPRVVLVGLGIFVTNAGLVLGIVWFTFLRFSLVSDHLVYLPLLGLALAAVGGLWALRPALGVSERTLAIAVGCWCALLAATSVGQTAAWTDSETLWTTTMAQNPDCLPCHVNLGMLVVDDDPATAAGHFERAVALDPDAMTLRRLGYARAVQGRDADAEAAYQHSLKLDGNDADTHYGVANALQRQEKYEAAIGEYGEALRLNPQLLDARHNLAATLFAAGRLAEAEAAITELMRLRPDDDDAKRLHAAIVAERSGGGR